MTAQEITNALINLCEKERSPLLLAGYGGSHAYGTNIPTSDIDIRGIFLNSSHDLFGIQNAPEQITLPDEDAIIYSLKKMMRLLLGCNPNVIEILGLRPEDYLFMTPTGQQLIDNREIFLSKAVIRTFGAYAYAQLNRLMNKSGRASDNIENNEVRSLKKMLMHSRDMDPSAKIDAYEKDNQVMISFQADCPIESFTQMAMNIMNVHSDYRSSTRNNKAIEHGKLSKHMMHLIRLYMTGIDILKDHQIVTYRTAEHGLLMEIRNGKYLNADKTAPTDEFQEVLNEYSSKFDEAAKHTTLPEKPNTKAANKLMMDIVSQYYQIKD